MIYLRRREAFSKRHLKPPKTASKTRHRLEETTLPLDKSSKKRSQRPRQPARTGMILKVRIPPLADGRSNKSHQWKNQSRQATNVGSLPVSSIKIYVVVRPRLCHTLKLLAIPCHLTACGSHQHRHQAVPILKPLFLTKSVAAVILLDLTV